VNQLQHHTNNAVLGAPEGMTREECRALPITRISYPDGSLACVSFWVPTPEELRLLNEGRPMRLAILGATHAPVRLWVPENDGDWL
jgi:hypothetical protein